MGFMDEVFKQGPKLLGKMLPDGGVELAFDRFVKARHIKLQNYYDIWRGRVRCAAENDTILSNGWAFSMMNGLSWFESCVRADETIKQIYFNKSGDIERMVDKIATQKHGKEFSGAMVYGYGNLLRESYFIEQARKAHLLRNKRIYLLDCSLFYHIFAQSQLNPLRQVIEKDKNIRPVLLDYCDGHQCQSRLSDIRNDLNPFFPILHLFLGNTFCNVDSVTLQQILTATVLPGDVVVAEYANYSEQTMQSYEPDYVNTMANRAAAELFATSESRVVTKTVRVDDVSKAVLIETDDHDNGGRLKFRSMLRRKYDPSELLDNEYKLVWSCEILSGSLRMDSYERLKGTE